MSKKGCSIIPPGLQPQQREGRGACDQKRSFWSLSFALESWEMLRSTILTVPRHLSALRCFANRQAPKWLDDGTHLPPELLSFLPVSQLSFDFFVACASLSPLPLSSLFFASRTQRGSALYSRIIVECLASTSCLLHFNPSGLMAPQANNEATTFSGQPPDNVRLQFTNKPGQLQDFHYQAATTRRMSRPVIRLEQLQTLRPTQPPIKVLPGRRSKRSRETLDHLTR